MFNELVWGFAAGIIFSLIYEAGYEIISKYRGKPNLVIFGNYHLHHSLYGVILIVLFFFLFNFYLLGAGISIIARHTATEGKFSFVEKTKA